MEHKEQVCSLDYVSEYEKIRDLNEKLTCEIKELKAQHNYMKSEFERMRAQLDIVYLIFGGKKL